MHTFQAKYFTKSKTIYVQKNRYEEKNLCELEEN